MDAKHLSLLRPLWSAGLILFFAVSSARSANVALEANRPMGLQPVNIIYMQAPVDT